MQKILEILANSNYDLSGCLVNCTNQGMCSVDQTTKTYGCQCLTNFRGSACQYSISSCSQYPCLNNGTCISRTNNATAPFECDCQHTYCGTYCEHQVDICANKTCSSNGYCYVIESEPKCKCHIDYSGEDCEVEDSFRKIIRYVQYISLIIVCTCYSILVTLVVSNDILNIFGVKNRRKIDLKDWKNKLKGQQQHVKSNNLGPTDRCRIIRFKYYNFPHESSLETNSFNKIESGD